MQRKRNLLLTGIMCCSLFFVYKMYEFKNPENEELDIKSSIRLDVHSIPTRSSLKYEKVSLSGSDSAPGIFTNEGGLVDAASAIVKKQGMVLFSVINDAYTQLAASWLCNTAPLGHLHSKVLFLTTDVSTGQQLQKQWPQINVVFVNSSAFSGDMKYSTVGYVRLMVERTRFIQRLVQARVRLLLFEVDFVWLADPLPTVLAYDADVVGIQVPKTSGKVICGCFLLLNPTPATVTVWSRLTQMMEELYKMIKAKGPNASVSQDTNDQTFLSQLLRNKHGGVKRAYLPQDLFPEGLWYTQTNLGSQPRPLVIHNNWIVGIQNKIARAKKFGHWFLTNSSTLSNLVCDDAAVNNVAVGMRNSSFL